MLDRFIYKCFEGLDIISLKMDSIFYAGYKKIGSLFKGKRKRK